MKPKWQKLASLAQEIRTLWLQFFGAVIASKGYPFKNLCVTKKHKLHLYPFVLLQSHLITLVI